jgi:hypothetical protein
MRPIKDHRYWNTRTQQVAQWLGGCSAEEHLLSLCNALGSGSSPPPALRKVLENPLQKKEDSARRAQDLRRKGK